MLAVYIISGIIVFAVAPLLLLCFILYRELLIRKNPSVWSRKISIPDDEEQCRIYKEGDAWAEKYASCRKDLWITSDGFKLAGEFFDFGFGRAAIIIPGRMETCMYSHFYAESYRKAGFDVLCIDNRSHGLSEGKYNSLGYSEYRDIIAWGRMLHDELGEKEIVLHGICVGASTALFAMTSPDCPDYLTAMTADGMYVTFGESFRLHMIKYGHPVFPFVPGVALWIRICTGADVMHDGPKYRIKNMKRPILFLHSRQDSFSDPDLAGELYTACPSEKKKLVYFERGEHSRLRINNPDLYDGSISDFYVDSKNK